MALTSTAAACLVIDLGASVGDAILGLAIFAIPGVAIPVIARTARRHPSRTLLADGRHIGGVRLFRWGLALLAVCLLCIVIALTPGLIDPTNCQADFPVLLVFGVVGSFLSALMIGGGWAWAIRGTWVVLATIAVLDILIFYTNVLLATEDPSAVRGLLLLAFIIHGVCTSLAARWTFRARDLGRIGRAKAGEAGRSLAAVWVFLASYTGLTLIRTESGIFDTAAGSAVIGALTLGALAVTMGSGFTKFAEAMYAEPVGSKSAVPVETTAPADQDQTDAGTT